MWLLAESTAASDVGTFIVFACVIGVAFCSYMFPFLVAGMRGHKQTTAIGALNLLLGWTVLGWIIALVWAFTHPR